MPVEWLWHGAMTATSFWVRGACDANPVRLAVTDLADTSFAAPTWFGPVDRGAYNVASIVADGLAADTPYRFAFEVDGTLDLDWQGTTRTFPTSGSATGGAWGAASCAGHGGGLVVTDGVSNHPLIGHLATLGLRFFVHTGDLFYRDNKGTDLGLYRDCYRDMLTYNQTEGASAHQGVAWRNIPFCYAWDDHDSFGGNNPDKNAEGKAEAQQAFRECVPHYPLPADTRPGGNGEVYQTFVYGRQRFILLDNRSERDPQEQTDDSAKSMIGPDQKSWLKEVLVAAQEPAICIMMGVPWVADDERPDTWWGYSTERQEICDFIAARGIAGKVWFLAGDMHGLAIDDGTNLAVQTGLNRPTVQAAPLDAGSSLKGGPYTQGPVGKTNAFGWFDTVDQGGDNIAVDVSLREWDT